MAKKKGTGLLVVATDVPADREEEFNRWYDQEHVYELLAIPGFLDAARYQVVRGLEFGGGGGPKYLAIYELESPEVIWSEQFQRHAANPSTWSRRMSPLVIGTNFTNNVYRQVFPAGVSETVANSDMAPALQIGRMDIPPETEDEFNEWNHTIYMPNFEKVPGCRWGRRHVAVRGQPKYLVMYDFDHALVSQSAEWRAARDSHPQSARIRPQVIHGYGSPGIFKKIFPL